MAKKKRKRKSAQQGNADLRTVIVKTLIGSVIGAVMFFLLVALMSLIVLKADMSQSPYKYMILGAGMISGFICGFAAVRPVRKNGIVVGALSALPMYLLAVTLATLNSRTGIGVIGWILLGVMIVFAAIGGILAVNKRK